MIAAGVVGGLLGFVIVCLAVAVILRRRAIKRKRTMRRLLREKEVRRRVLFIEGIEVIGLGASRSEMVRKWMRGCRMTSEFINNVVQ